MIPFKEPETEPFKHWIFDNAFDPKELQELLDVWPMTGWHVFNNDKESKIGMDYAMCPPLFKKFLEKFTTPETLAEMEKLTVMDNLKTDELLYGGGLHQVLNAGFLEIHTDFNYLERWNLTRRINLILYLNHDWKEEYGGALELWDENGIVKKIVPLFNRLVIFFTDSNSWHGHPELINCPRGMSRKSVAIYYYQEGPPEKQKGPTWWKEKNAKS